MENNKMLYRISKLITAYFSGTCTEEGEAELMAWRNECEENERLFKRVMSSDRFKKYIQESGEFDYLKYFTVIDRKIKRDRRKLVLRRVSYAAALIPFILAAILILHNREIEKIPVKHLPIEPGYAQAVLTTESGRMIRLEKLEVHGRLGSNMVADHDTLRYLAQDGGVKSELHKLSIPRGGEFFVKLSDGTKVWLNSDSEFEYPTSFAEGERVVSLKGEAYFEVTHDEQKPFVVKSGKQRVRVLGTSFAVQAYEDGTPSLTTLEKGCVEVIYERERVVLEPGEQSLVKDEEVVVREVNTFEYTAWRNGVFIFVDMPLVQIMNTLSKWYNINVFYASSSLGDIRFTGELRRYADIEELLHKFEVLEKVKFQINNRTVIISEY
ncbi:FecR family protein [Butyricimonas sp. Marseille-P3923]|uniref:FecR family protein n=1 Tax=Butyricimonas sp. Marseille-P3923 TaxID=1987504 RepID=UPI000C0759EA|nr:FecR domain-containing protein [Butyricimonas sp. Marseille-P3923]